MHPARDPASRHLTEVRLYGHLARRFGRVFRLDVRTPAEAVRALSSQLAGFRQHLIDRNEPGYRVYSGRDPVTSTRLHDPSGRATIRIVPVTAGAKSKAFGIILGVGLIAASFFLPITPLVAGFDISASSLALNLGISMTLSGVSGLLAGSPRSTPTSQERPDNLPSYAFNGAVNTVGQGGPVQVVYGRAVVGSQVISAGLHAEPV